MNATAGYPRYLGIYKASRCHMALGGLTPQSNASSGCLIVNDLVESKHLGSLLSHFTKILTTEYSGPDILHVLVLKSKCADRNSRPPRTRVFHCTAS